MSRSPLLRAVGGLVLVPALVLGGGPALGQAAASVPEIPTSEPSAAPEPSDPAPSPEPEPSPEPAPASPSPSRAAPAPARTTAPPPPPPAEQDGEDGAETVPAPSPVETSDLPFAEVPAPSPEAVEPTEQPQPVADQPAGADPLTRLVQLAVGGALLLGAAGATGLYLTRDRPEETP